MREDRRGRGSRESELGRGCQYWFGGDEMREREGKVRVREESEQNKSANAIENAGAMAMQMRYAERRMQDATRRQRVGLE